MKQRYCEPSDPPDVLLDWVSENVADAIRASWSEDVLTARVDLSKDGKLVMWLSGEENPDTFEPYYFEFDFVSMLPDFASAYDDVLPVNGGARDDLLKRADALQNLADVAAKLAQSCREKAG